jgi:hypothetical protein
LSKGIISTRKQDIALKASMKSKKRQIVIENSSEEEEGEGEDDDEGMTLFIKNYNKSMAKRRALKGNKGEKLRTRSKRERERKLQLW